MENELLDVSIAILSCVVVLWLVVCWVAMPLWWHWDGKKYKALEDLIRRSEHGKKQPD